MDTRYVDAFPRYAYRSFLEVSSLLRDAGSSKLTATLGHVRNNRGTRDTRLACPSDSSSSLPPPLRPETISSPSLLNRTRFYISILYIYIWNIFYISIFYISYIFYIFFLIYSTFLDNYYYYYERDEAPCFSSVKRGRERERGGEDLRVGSTLFRDLPASRIGEIGRCESFSSRWSMNNGYFNI